MLGVEEVDEEERRDGHEKLYDGFRVEQVLLSMDLGHLVPKSINRLGNWVADQTRLIVIEFVNNYERELVMQNSFKLRQLWQENQVFVRRDMIKKDRVEASIERLIRKTRRETEQRMYRAGTGRGYTFPPPRNQTYPQMARGIMMT